LNARARTDAVGRFEFQKIAEVIPAAFGFRDVVLPRLAGHDRMLRKVILVRGAVVVIIDRDQEIRAALGGQEVAHVAAIVGIVRHEIRRKTEPPQNTFLFIQRRAQNVKALVPQFRATQEHRGRSCLIGNDDDLNLFEVAVRREIRAVPFENNRISDGGQHQRGAQSHVYIRPDSASVESLTPQ
jgi:hypothetical protein